MVAERALQPSGGSGSIIPKRRHRDRHRDRHPRRHRGVRDEAPPSRGDPTRALASWAANTCAPGLVLIGHKARLATVRYESTFDSGRFAWCRRRCVITAEPDPAVRDLQAVSLSARMSSRGGAGARGARRVTAATLRARAARGIRWMSRRIELGARRPLRSCSGGADPRFPRGPRGLAGEPVEGGAEIKAEYAARRARSLVALPRSPAESSKRCELTLQQCCDRGPPLITSATHHQEVQRARKPISKR